MGAGDLYCVKAKYKMAFWFDGGLKVTGSRDTLSINLNDDRLLVLSTLIRKKYGFTGFPVSDWSALNELSATILQTNLRSSNFLRINFRLGPVNTNSQSLRNECQDDKSGEKDIKLVKTAENPAIALKSSKEPFNFVSATIGNTIQLPRVQAVWIGRHDRRVAQLSRQS